MESIALLLISMIAILSIVSFSLDKKISVLSKQNDTFISILKAMSKYQDSSNQAINNQGDIISEIILALLKHNLISEKRLNELLSSLPNTLEVQDEQKL